MWIEAISGGGVTPTPITPSDATPAQMLTGTAYEPTTSGYAIKSYYDLTPSNPPHYLTNGKIYKANSAGWAIDDYSDITPTTSGAYFASGMRRMSSSGYAFSQMPSVEDYLDTLNTADAYSITFADLEIGKKYLLLVWNWSSSGNLYNTRFDDTTTSDGTLTKITNLRTGSGTARAAGTFFLFEPSSATVTLTCANKMQAHLITAVL